MERKRKKGEEEKDGEERGEGREREKREGETSKHLCREIIWYFSLICFSERFIFPESWTNRVWDETTGMLRDRRPCI